MAAPVAVTSVDRIIMTDGIDGSVMRSSVSGRARRGTVASDGESIFAGQAARV